MDIGWDLGRAVGRSPMTPGPHRHGRRDNGLHASEYAVAGDVDPRVGEHLLDVLGLAGIAAYLQPTADLHPVTRTTTLPSRPIDRLYVDRAHLPEAREYLDRLGPAAGPSAGTDPARAPQPELDPTAPQPPVREDGGEPLAGPTFSGEGAASEPTTDIDAAWAAIIADYDIPANDPVPRWPVAEDLSEATAPGDAATPARTAPDTVADANPDAAATSSAGRPPGDWRTDPDRPDLIDSLDGELDDDEGYEPPPPPPIPRPSRYAALAIGAIALGLVLCIRPDLLNILGFGFGEAGGLAIGFICLLTGFVTLVVRLRPGGDDDDSDDGAVV